MKAKPTVVTSALVIGAALLGPAASRVSTGAPVEAAQTLEIQGITLTPKAKEAGGPWQAYCSYWGPSPVAADAKKEQNQKGPVDPATKEAAKQECVGSDWGSIPEALTAADRSTTALVATVPDPIHSSMSLEFDRMIDVIMQAAEDNGYVVSYYWLPWHRIEKNKATAKAKAQEEEHDEAQEHQPGLLILKPSDPKCDLVRDTSPHPDSGFCNHLIYMFLVGQTPALGMNRFQLSNALEYESDLWRDGKANLSLRHPDNEADIIGPNNSGAASSLRWSSAGPLQGSDFEHRDCGQYLDQPGFWGVNTNRRRVLSFPPLPFVQ